MPSRTAGLSCLRPRIFFASFGCLRSPSNSTLPIFLDQECSSSMGTDWQKVVFWVGDRDAEAVRAGLFLGEALSIRCCLVAIRIGIGRFQGRIAALGRESRAPPLRAAPHPPTTEAILQPPNRVAHRSIPASLPWLGCALTPIPLVLPVEELLASRCHPATNLLPASRCHPATNLHPASSPVSRPRLASRPQPFCGSQFHPGPLFGQLGFGPRVRHRRRGFGYGRVRGSFKTDNRQ